MQTGLLNIKGALGAGEFQLLLDRTIGDDIYTKLLLHFDGQNGGKEIIDSTSPGHVGTQNGVAALTSAQQKFGATSIYFNSADGSFVNFPNSTDWNLGAAGGGNDWTVDFWVNFRVAPVTPGLVGANFGASGWIIGYSTTGVDSINIYDGAADTHFGTWVPTPGTWYHVAVVRSGTTITCYINGYSIGTAPDGSYNNDGISLTLGASNTNGTNSLDGYLDEVRISKGIARWTANFTPPTAVYATDSYTVLLCHMETLDTSAYRTNPTYVGTAQLQTSVYKVAGGNNGAALFNGSSTYVSYPDSPDFATGTGDLTIDCWVNWQAGGSTSYTICGQMASGTARWGLFYDTSTSKFQWYINLGGSGDVYITQSNTYNLLDSVWHHVAAVRSGSNWYFFVDGVQQGTTQTSSVALVDVAAVLIVGQQNSNNWTKGYIDEIRISNSARWTSGFTPQTTQYTTDQYTKLLCHYDLDFNDSSGTGYTVSIGAGRPKGIDWKLGNGALSLDGSTQYLTVPDSADWYFTGDFTIDFWVRFNGLPSSGNFMQFIHQGDGLTNYYMWFHIYNSTGTYKLRAFHRDGGGGINSIDLTWSTPVTNRWYHIAYVMNGSSFTIYVDGTSIGSLSESNTFGNYAGNLCIGAYKWNDDPGNGNYLNGYIDELRISKGLARWTANFTPSTSEYASDANTQLLLHCNYDFTDSGNTGHTVTAVAGAGVTSLRRIGTGSALFNGSSSYLTVVDSDDWDFGTGDFTIDFWTKFNSLPSSGTQRDLFGHYTLATNGSYRCYFYNNTGTYELRFSWRSGGSETVDAETWTPFVAVWYHIAVVRTSGTMRLFVNGVQLGTDTANAADLTLSGSQVFSVGWYGSGTEYLNGYIDEFRLSKGIARWTTGFTPSSTAYTTDSYTKLLMHMDDDGPRDSSGLNKTVTNTGVDGAQRWMFGNASGFFNGTSAYLTYPDSTDWTFGSGDFTIDLWVRFKSYGVCIFAGQWVNASNYWAFYVVDAGGGNYNLQFVETSGAVVHAQFNTTSPWAPAVNRWYHVAFVRSGSTAYMFVDGTSQAVTQVTAFGTLGDIAADLAVGALNGASFVNGWIDEVRISKGIARWTANFTVPSSAYTTDANTKLLLHMDETSYLDASGVNYPVTVTGTTEAATAKIGTGSARFNGTSAYISVPDSDDWQLGGGTGNFTVDLWVRFNTLQNTILVAQRAGAGDYWQVYFSNTGSYLNFDNVTATTETVNITCTWAPTTNTWYHIAIVRKGTANLSSDWLFTIDGASQSLTLVSGAWNGTIGNHAAALTIGQMNSANYLSGYLDEVRVSNTARWTSGFTPQTTEYATDSYTKLLLHLNTDVTDSSSLTAPKNPTNTNVLFLTPKRGTGACFFDGSTGYLTVPDGEDWNFGTGNFTIDTWINIRAFDTGDQQWIIGQYNSGNPIRLYVNSAGTKLSFDSYNGASYDIAIECSYTFSTNTWYHIALTRSGSAASNWNLFVNGVSQIITKTQGSYDCSLQNAGGNLTIGVRNSDHWFKGWIDELRISKGIARWSGNFSTPYPINYTTDTYTKLLLHFDGDTTDSSNAGHPATVTSVLLEQPKIGTSSLLFNGTSAYLTVPTSPDWDLGANDFTIDFWTNLKVLPTSGNSFMFIYQQKASAWKIAVKLDNTAGIYSWKIYGENAGGSPIINVSQNTTITTGTWYHVAFVRRGNDFTIYQNGVSLGTAADTDAFIDGGNQLDIGYYSAGPSSYVNGWMDEVRISKGIARWTAAFTPQTTAYTADYYTVLLLHGDTLDMTDVMGKVVTVVSGAKVNKTAKIGTGALLLNGTSDYLTIPDSTDWYFGSGDFTIDCWVRFNSVSASDAFFEQYQDNSHFSAFGWVQGTNVLRWYHINLSPDTYAYCSWTPTVNTWYHVAFVRNGSNALIFIDGVSQPVTLDGWIDVPDYAGTVRIGLYTDQSHYMNGSIDELRISKGIARWTAGFTPQVTPYTQDQYTVLLLHFDHADESNSGYDVTNTSTFITNYKFGSDLLLLNGTSEYLSVPDSTDWNFSYDPFTIDFWFHVTAGNVWFSRNLNSSNYFYMQLVVSTGTAYFTVTSGGSYVFNIAAAAVGSLAVGWHHFALVRTGREAAATAWRIFIDGVSRTLTLSNGAWDAAMTANAAPFLIGADVVQTSYTGGAIEEFRISNTARWTANFTPPSSAYTADSSTKLLLHFDGDQSDSGARGSVPTNTATVLSKYGYFGDSGLLLDGNSDYISFPLISSYQFGNADFTIEARVRFNSISGYQYILNTYTSSNNGWELLFDGTTNPTTLYFAGFNGGSGTVVGTWVPTINRWYHVAVVRYGSTISEYIDGVLIKTGTATSGFVDSTNSLLTVGVYYNGVATYNFYVNGWIDEVRISHTARWTANFTPPTVAYTDDTQYPLTSLTVSGLDGDTDKEYLLVTRFIDGYNGTTNFLLRFNGDSGANYGEQRLTASGTSLTAARATTDTGIEICDASARDFVTQGSTLIYAKSGFPRSVLVQDIHDTFGTSVNLIEVQGNVWNNTADNITSMSITASQVGGMGIGSQMLLFVRKVPTSGSGTMTGPLAPLSAVKGIGLVKIYETTLTAAASSITVSGLNGDTDEVYMIEMSRYAAIGNKTMYIRPNNDSGSNYGYQFMQGTSTTASAARNTSQTGLQFTSTNSAGMCLAKAYLFAKTDFIRTMVSEETDQISGTTVGYSVAFGTVWNNPHDNITSLVFAISDGTNDIGIGTNLRIYALRKAT